MSVSFTFPSGSLIDAILNGHAGPYEYSGNVFVVGAYDNGTNVELSVWWSSAVDSSWTRVGSGITEASAKGSNPFLIRASYSGQYVDVIYTRTATNGSLRYIQFDMSAKTFGSQETVTTGISSVSMKNMAVGRRSGGNVFAAIGNSTVTLYERTSSSWPNSADIGGGISSKVFDGVTILSGASARVTVLWCNTTDGVASLRPLSAYNSLNSIVTVANTGSPGLLAMNAEMSGTSCVCAFTQSSTLKAIEWTEDGAPTVSLRTVTSTTIDTGMRPSVGYVSSTEYVGFKQSSDGKPYYCTSVSGGSWSADTATTGATGTWSGRAFTRNSTNVMGMVSAASPGVYWDTGSATGGGGDATVTHSAASILARGGTHTVSATRNATVAHTAASVVVNGGANTASAGSNATVTHTAASIVTNGGVHSPSATRNATVAHTAASIVTQGGVHSPSTSGNATVSHTAASIPVTGGAHTVTATRNATVTHTTASALARGGAHAVSTATNATVTHAAASILLNGGAHTVSATRHATVSLATGSVVVSGGGNSPAAVSEQPVAVERRHRAYRYRRRGGEW